MTPKPTLHSHTITHILFILKGVREPQAVCQVAPADTQAKTWQRVCLPHRTTNRQSGRKRNSERTTALTVAQPPL